MVKFKIFCPNKSPGQKCGPPPGLRTTLGLLILNYSWYSGTRMNIREGTLIRCFKWFSIDIISYKIMFYLNHTSSSFSIYDINTLPEHYTQGKISFLAPSPLNQLIFMKLSGQRVLKNRQWVSVTGLRNRQSSLRNSAKLDDIFIRGHIRSSIYVDTRISHIWHDCLNGDILAGQWRKDLRKN